MLLEQGMLPRIVAGSSVGSIVSALIATHTDEELNAMFAELDSIRLNFFSNSTTRQFLSHLLTKGTLHDIEYLKVSESAS